MQILLAHLSVVTTYQKHVHTIAVDFFSSKWDIFARFGQISCQEWTALAKKETFYSFLLNTAQKIFNVNEISTLYCRNYCMYI